MLAQKRLDPSLNTQGGKDEERQMCLGDEASSRPAKAEPGFW